MMNKEFMVISDKEVVVSDENGCMEKKNINNVGNTERVLINENMIEDLNNKISNYDQKIEDYNHFVSLSQFMMAAISTLLVVTVTSSFISEGIARGITSFNYCLIPFGVTVVFYFVTKKVSAKKKDKYTKKKDIALSLKKQYEEEIKKLRDKTMTDKKIEKEKSISLFEQTRKEKKVVDEELGDNKSKKLIKKIR